MYRKSQNETAPPTQDATLPVDKIRIGEKVNFFCMHLQGINKKVLGERAGLKYIEIHKCNTVFLIPEKNIHPNIDFLHNFV